MKPANLVAFYLYYVERRRRVFCYYLESVYGHAMNEKKGNMPLTRSDRVIQQYLMNNKMSNTEVKILGGVFNLRKFLPFWTCSLVTTNLNFEWPKHTTIVIPGCNTPYRCWLIYIYEKIARLRTCYNLCEGVQFSSLHARLIV